MLLAVFDPGQMRSGEELRGGGDSPGKYPYQPWVQASLLPWGQSLSEPHSPSLSQGAI